jgi:hypothetical protein
LTLYQSQTCPVKQVLGNILCNQVVKLSGHGAPSGEKILANSSYAASNPSVTTASLGFHMNLKLRQVAKLCYRFGAATPAKP